MVGRRRDETENVGRGTRDEGSGKMGKAVAWTFVVLAVLVGGLIFGAVKWSSADTAKRAAATRAHQADLMDAQNAREQAAWAPVARQQAQMNRAAQERRAVAEQAEAREAAASRQWDEIWRQGREEWAEAHRRGERRRDAEDAAAAARSRSSDRPAIVCPECGGCGKVNTSSYPLTCPRCNGKGFVAGE